MNRFIINLRSLYASGLSQCSTRQHWSSFSAPNFRIPDSFLGNIGENLQEGYEPAEGERVDDWDEEASGALSDIQGLPETEQVGDSSTAPGSSTSYPTNVSVSRPAHLRMQLQTTFASRSVIWTSLHARKPVRPGHRPRSARCTLCQT